MASPNEIVQRVAMKAVIVREGRVLLLREATTHRDGTQHGRYGIPGGKIEPGEAWQDGLRREVREETGLRDLTIIRPIFVGEWRPVVRGTMLQIIATFHVCEASRGQILLSEEHDAYEWVDAENWKTLNVMRPDDEVLTVYFASQKS